MTAQEAFEMWYSKACSDYPTTMKYETKEILINAYLSGVIYGLEHPQEPLDDRGLYKLFGIEK